MKFFLILLIFLLFPIKAQAANIYGLHLSDTSDITKAAAIINSNNGDWGYVTVVIRSDLLNHQMWQEFFDKCRVLHITPIIRLATSLENDHWKRPEINDIDIMTNFLNSLNWPQQQQIITLFNEPNHGSEWGGEVDVKNFVDISIYAAQKLKKLNPNFYILSGGIDLAAPSKLPAFESATVFYQEIVAYKPDYFDNIDAIANHYYPANSPRNYIWELNTIKKLGIKKDLPVYITETGVNNKKIAGKILINNINTWSKDRRVVAVTPFIFNYPYPPFEQFSWLTKEGTLNFEYQRVVNLPKTKNTISQLNSYKVIFTHLPFIIFPNTVYHSAVEVQNTGQSIWGETQFCLKQNSSPNITLSDLCIDPNKKTFPNQVQKIPFSFEIKYVASPSYISWENLPQYDLSLLSPSSTIYHPKTSLWNYVKEWWSGLF
ncbi:MAG: hypothetical protein WC069_01470 [Candidatus Shapirobacteria bacterium]